MEHLKNITWSLRQPLNEAQYYKNDPDPMSVPVSVWNTKLNIRKNDKVAVLYDDEEPVIFEPIRGSTIGSLFAALDRGLNKIIPNNRDNTKIVYSSIGNWLKSKDRLELAKLFERNKLTPRNLLGDHDFYNGSMQRDNGGVWNYYLES